MAAASTDKLKKLSRKWVGQIGAAGVSDAVVTTIPLSSTTNLPTDTAVVATIDRVDSNGTKTPTLEESVIGVVSGSNLVTSTRGAEGTAQAHAAGAVVEILVTAKGYNDIIDHLLVEHNQDGTHLSSVVTTLTGTQTLTNKTLTSPVLTTPIINTSFSGTAKATATTVAAGTNDDTIVTPLAVAPYGNYSMARQAIINGNFDVWQRGTTLTPTDVTVQYLADHWLTYIAKDGGTLPTLAISRQLQTPGALQSSYYFWRLNTNGAGTSLGVNSRGQLSNRIENGVRNLCGASKKVTVSFYAKSDIANKKIGIGLEQVYGSGGSPTATEVISGTTVTLTSSWVKYTATFTTNTLTGKTFGTANDDYIQLNLWYVWGSTTGTNNGLGSAETFIGSGNVDIAQVQLCAGDVALPFQPKSFEEEELTCKRYYEKSFDYGTTPAQNTASDQAQEDVTPMTGWTNRVYYKVKKRATAPTVTIYNPAAANASVRDLTAGADISPTLANKTENGFLIFGTAAAADHRLSFNWTSESEL